MQCGRQFICQQMSIFRAQMKEKLVGHLQKKFLQKLVHSHLKTPLREKI